MSELTEIADWLENEAKGLMKQAMARESSAKCMRDASASELKSAKALAEKMAGRKLNLVSVSVKAARADAEIQERIGSKLEVEARKLAAWAAFLRQL